ncbi:MAG: hypothetical protein JWM47_3274 [Acidimicrobiales bacterium]|nr:hypothetical protein [Acidimicrobiales bacterium]
MNIANRCVGTVLRSPAHRLLSGSTCLVRYRDRRSGRTYLTPTQYATQGPDIVILVARPDAKTWWRRVATRAVVHHGPSQRMWEELPAVLVPGVTAS